MKKIIVIILAVAMLLSLPIAAHAAGWTKRQEQAHNLADDARDMGFSEDSAAIKIMQDIFAYESGDDSVQDSYYYSGRTKQSYKLIVTNANPDGGYFDGEYLWYLDENSGYYYRYDKSGKKITGEKAKQYESFAGKKLWDGIITDVDSYINSNDAKSLAQFILSYADLTDGSVRQRAELAWCLLNYKGDKSMDEALDGFEDYKELDVTTAKGKEALRIAKDVLFRKYVESYGYYYGGGNRDVGRVLPEGYSWMWIQGKEVSLRASMHGANWDHSSPSPYKER